MVPAHYPRGGTLWTVPIFPIIFLTIIFAPAIVACLYLIFNKHGHVFLIPSIIIAALILARIFKVIKKARLEFLNGPKRFCKGKGIEIGSCGRHLVENSILVDIADNFSSPIPYKVDYIADAHYLPGLESASLDYVCASHVLEHMTNPIKAILEWMRILKPGGMLWLKIPDKRKTFDINRKRTTLIHLIEDFENNVPVDDPTHIDDQNKNSCSPRNVNHPYVHNHVWIPEDIIELFNYLSEKHAALKIMHCTENSCKNAQDFWIVVQKRNTLLAQS